MDGHLFFEFLVLFRLLRVHLNFIRPLHHKERDSQRQSDQSRNTELGAESSYKERAYSRFCFNDSLLFGLGGQAIFF